MYTLQYFNLTIENCENTNYSFLTALFKEHQEKEDTVGNLQKEKERLQLQIQDMNRQLDQVWPSQQQQQQQSQQLQQQSSSSQQLPVVQHPDGPTGNGPPSTSSSKKEQVGPQVFILFKSPSTQKCMLNKPGGLNSPPQFKSKISRNVKTYFLKLFRLSRPSRTTFETVSIEESQSKSLDRYHI